jgi:hypothetical protein
VMRKKASESSRDGWPVWSIHQTSRRPKRLTEIKSLLKRRAPFTEKKEDLDTFVALLLPNELAQQELIIEPQDRPALRSILTTLLCALTASYQTE